jgi:1-phosphofructokinase family hexose kinase
MIRVVGANPAMDRVDTWPPLRLGEVNRASGVAVVPGGKGFNVARAAVRLGAEAAAYGFLGGHVGEALREMVVADGLIDRHTTIAAGTRVCFIAVEPEVSRTTVLNEPGPDVTPEETARFLDDLRADCRPGDLVILSGSLPDSVDPSVAGEIVAIGNAAAAGTLVDIHGEALRSAVEQQPWMLKCNRHELLQLIDDGHADSRDAPESLPGLAREMLRLQDAGLATVVVTLGADGALIADAEGVAHVDVPDIDEVNPTGSGDLLLAGLAVGIERGGSMREAMALGAACGTAGATHLPPELPPGFAPAEWMARISIEPIEP